MEKYKKLHEDYLTGQYNSVSLAAKHGMKHRAARMLIYFGNWMEELQALGLPVPEEPKFGPPVRHPDKVWQEIEADFMTGMSVLKLSAKYDIHTETINKRVKRYHWRLHRNQLVDATRSKLSGTVATKMVAFEEMAMKFIDAATMKLGNMISQVNGATTPDELETLIRQYNKLYATVREMPQNSRGKIPEKSPISTLPPAQRPAPILKIT